MCDSKAGKYLGDRVKFFEILTPVCHICDDPTEEDFICERCGQFYCPDCTAPFDSMTCVDYNCCSSCYDTMICDQMDDDF